MTHWILFKVWLLYGLPIFLKQVIQKDSFWFGLSLGLVIMGITLISVGVIL